MSEDKKTDMREKSPCLNNFESKENNDHVVITSILTAFLAVTASLSQAEGGLRQVFYSLTAVFSASLAIMLITALELNLKHSFIFKLTTSIAIPSILSLQLGGMPSPAELVIAIQHPLSDNSYDIFIVLLLVGLPTLRVPSVNRFAVLLWFCVPAFVIAYLGYDTTLADINNGKVEGVETLSGDTHTHVAGCYFVFFWALVLFWYFISMLANIPIKQSIKIIGRNSNKHF